MHPHLRAADVRGYSRLAIDATLRMTDLVEAMHSNIAATAWPFGRAAADRTSGITGFVYDAIRGIGGAVGNGLELALANLAPLIDRMQRSGESSYVREGVLALINGIIGDHLEASGNPLAIPMSFRHGGVALPLDPQSLAAAMPEAGHRVLVMVHGLCMNDLEFKRNDHDHGIELARSLGYTPVYLHYNSGRHVSANGRDFSDLLESLLQAWPMHVDQLAIVGFSMGGLLTRSACHYAALSHHRWLDRLTHAIFVGTPHQGAPLERGGNRLQWLAGITPYTAPLGRLGMIRSAGITDLRHGSLLDADWQGRNRFAHHEDLRTAVPLPTHVRCYALAASTGARSGDLSDTLLGDGIVFLDSALGLHADGTRALNFEEDRRRILYKTSHLGLLDSHEAYQQMRHWLQNS